MDFTLKDLNQDIGTLKKDDNLYTRLQGAVLERIQTNLTKLAAVLEEEQRYRVRQSKPRCPAFGPMDSLKDDTDDIGVDIRPRRYNEAKRELDQALYGAKSVGLENHGIVRKYSPKII